MQWIKCDEWLVQYNEAVRSAQRCSDEALACKGVLVPIIEKRNALEACMWEALWEANRCWRMAVRWFWFYAKLEGWE